MPPKFRPKNLVIILTWIKQNNTYFEHLSENRLIKGAKLSYHFLKESVFDIVPERRPGLNLYQIKGNIISNKIKENNFSSQLFFGCCKGC